MLRWAEVLPCDICRRVTARTKRGTCTQCTKRTRRRNRQAKAALISSGAAPLVRYGALLNVADNLWSAWLRAYWTACEMCSRPCVPGSLQCAHGFSRQIRAIRFDEDNTFALCSSCHRTHTPPGPDWWDWMRARLSVRRYASQACHSRPRALLSLQACGADPIGAYERIELAARVRRGKLTAFALRGVIADAQQRLEALPEGERREWARARAEKALTRIATHGVRVAQAPGRVA